MNETKVNYVIHANHLGEYRYQPKLNNGQRLIRRTIISLYGSRPAQLEWTFSRNSTDAVLYKSRWRATRVAVKEMRRRERLRRKEFEEVENDR